MHYISDSCDDDELGSTCSYYKHIHFIDYREFNRTNPIYINMVRHPVDRMLSWYYYIRSTKYLLSTTDMPPRRIKVSFDECIQKE